MTTTRRSSSPSRVVQTRATRGSPVETTGPTESGSLGEPAVTIDPKPVARSNVVDEDAASSTRKTNPWSKVMIPLTKIDASLSYASTAFGISAAILQSNFVAMLLNFLPADDKLFAVGLICAGLRILCLFLSIVVDPASRSSLKAAAVNACRLCSSVAVNMMALLPQPLFTTISGGAFTGGDASKVLTLRLGRTLWNCSAATEALPPGLSALFLYYAFNKIDDARLHAAYLAAAAAAAAAAAFSPLATDGDESDGSALGVACSIFAYALFAVVLVAAALGAIAGRAGAKTVPSHFELPGSWKGAKTVYKASSGVVKAMLVGASWRVVCTFGYLHVFERLSGIDLGGTLASVPSSWLMSRQEIVLLSNWTDPANDSWWLRAAWRFEGLPAVLLIIGDILMNTPTMPAYLGVLGVALVRFALHLSGIEPLDGLLLVFCAWFAKLATEKVGQLLGVKETEFKYGLGTVAELKVDEGKNMKKGSAALEIKVPSRAQRALGQKLKFDEALLYCLYALCMVQMYRQPLNLSLPEWLLPQNWSTVGDLCPSASSGFAESCAVCLASVACYSAITIVTVAFATVSTIGAAALAATAFTIATVALLVELAVHYVIVMPLVWLAGPWVLDELSAAFAFTISIAVLDTTVALAGVAITAASVALAFTMTSVTGPFSFNVMLLALYILIYAVDNAFSRFKTFLLGGKTQDGKPVESVPDRMLSNIFRWAFESAERASINMVTAPVTAPPPAATPAPAATPTPAAGAS